MVGVPVARQHLDAQRLHLARVHGFAVHSLHQPGLYLLLLQRPQHAIPPVLAPLQIDHEDLIKAHLVWLLRGDRDKLRGLRWRVFHHDLQLHVHEALSLVLEAAV